MKKKALSLIACVALLACAIWAYEAYHEVLAAVLFIGSFIPSCLVEEEREGE